MAKFVRLSCQYPQNPDKYYDVWVNLGQVQYFAPSDENTDFTIFHLNTQTLEIALPMHEIMAIISAKPDKNEDQPAEHN